MLVINEIQLLKLFQYCKSPLKRVSSGYAQEVRDVCPCLQQEPCVPDTHAVDPSCPQPKVLVVGAGIAGLSAAHRLIKGGLRDVTIIEALDRPGGRIHTVKVGDSAVELGAGWIYGACMANPVFCLGCEAGIMDTPLYRRTKHRGYCFLSSGKCIPSRVCVSAARLFDGIVQAARDKVGKTPPSLSLWKFVDEEIKKVSKRFPKYDSEVGLNVLYGLTNNLRSLLGTDLENVPLSRFGNWKHLPGGDVVPKTGLSGVLAPLLKDIPPSYIKLNKPIRTIRWNPPVVTMPRVAVHTCDGEKYEGDYAIVTLPLGVLKNQHEEIFIPKLPPDKLKAIEHIQFGHVNNICLQYDRPFWVHNEGCMRSCWSREELQEHRDWTKCIGKIEDVPNNNDVLITTIAGEAAKCIEQMTDYEVSIEMTKILRCFLGDPTIPLPNKILCSKWSSSPYSQGGLTFLGQKSFESDQRTLALPIPEIGVEKAPMILFAGEACFPGYQGTTHGARLSGLREAERILNYTKCFCGPPPPPAYRICATT